MAKPKLDWATINLKTSDRSIVTAFDAEQDAASKTDAAVRKIVAQIANVPPEQVRVGRNWGKLSYAIDTEAKGAAAPVALVAPAGKGKGTTA
jgi:hypothetical protein